MKNKILKIFKTILFSIILAIGLVHANAYAIPTTYCRDGSTIKIHNEEAGSFYLPVLFNQTCPHIIVTGKMNSSDLNSLSFCIPNSKTLDLSDIIMIPDKDGVTRTPQYRFYGSNDVYYDLEEVIFPPNLQEIVGSFCNLPNLKRVTLPKNLRFLFAFQNCPNLKMEVPADVKLGNNVFYGSPGVRVLKKGLIQKLACIFV